MIVEAGLALSRFAHDAALIFLFGLTLFPFYTATPAAFAQRMRRSLTAAAVAAMISGITWAAFTAAAMQDDIAGAVDPGTLSALITDTDFGPIWLARLLLLLMLTIVVASNRNTRGVECAVAAVALASIALTGHTQMQDGVARIAHIASDAAHLLAAGAWLGGIAGLLMLLARTGDDDSDVVAAAALRDFGTVGSIAVATLLASGIANSLFMLNAISALINTTYGQLLLAKIVLFASMLGLAASNRFRLVPKLDTARGATLKAFKRQIAIEQAAGLGLLALVAVLGMTEPPM